MKTKSSHFSHRNSRYVLVQSWPLPADHRWFFVLLKDEAFEIRAPHQKHTHAFFQVEINPARNTNRPIFFFEWLMSYYFHSAISWRNSLNKKEKQTHHWTISLHFQLRPEIESKWPPGLRRSNASIMPNAKRQTARAWMLVWRCITCPCCKGPLFEIAADGGMKWLLKKSPFNAMA